MIRLLVHCVCGRAALGSGHFQGQWGTNRTARRLNPLPSWCAAIRIRAVYGTRRREIPQPFAICRDGKLCFRAIGEAEAYDRFGWISAVPVSGTDREKRTLGSSKFMPKAKRQILIRVIK